MPGYPEVHRTLRLLFTYVTAVGLVAATGRPAVAAPWWWAGFTIGDGTNTSNSPFERWQAFHINQANDATDTAYCLSYTWGSADIGTINGIAGGNNVGLNAVSAAGGRPTYLIGDNSANWPNASTLSDADVTDVSDGAGTMHIKDSFVDRGSNSTYFISSANHTAGGWDAQNNNAIVFFGTGLSAMYAKVRNQMNECAAGTFHDNTAYGTINFFSPYGDTIELRYAPDDNDGNLTAGSNSIGGRLATLAQNATQSILYAVDGWSITGANQLDDKILNNNVVTIVGCAGDASSGGGTDDWDATVYSNFQADHTMRNQSGAFNRLHTKMMIFDQEIVATGSPNYTFTAMGSTSGNDEAHVIVHDFRLARRFIQGHWRKIMGEATPDPSGDAYDVTDPAAPTGFTVTATDTAFYASWTPAATADITRYYLFIDTAPLSDTAIGDGVDNDGDSMIDEDPRGDADKFPSGTTAAGATANDDDADGSTDEDRWMYPEVQAKGRATSSAAITTWNVGDTLLPGVNYYFAIVSVDTQGNEPAPATFGPLQLGAADTRLVVSKNSDTGSLSVPRGSNDTVVGSFFVRGDTAGTGDTLSIFRVTNVGLADSQDVVVRLWRDENRDSNVDVGIDTFVATCTTYTAASRQWTAFLAADSRTYLGSGATAGRNYLVTIDVYNTATIGETFQARIDARSCSSVKRDSGPTSAVTNAGVFTIASANPVDVLIRGDSPSANILKGAVDSPVMQVRVTVAAANDTLQVFHVRNLGSMTSADVSALRLYHDGDGDSTIDAAPTDTLISVLPFQGAADSWGADTLAYRFTGTSIDLIVALSVSAGATAGRTFQAQVGANSVDCVNADTGPSSARTTTAVFTIPSDTGPDTAVLINEFIVDPATSAPPDHDNDAVVNDADEEYFELYNNSDQYVDVGGWDISDSGALPDVTLPAPLVLSPRQYLMIFADETWYRFDSGGAFIESGAVIGTFPGLDNTGDSGILRNDADSIIDVTPILAPGTNRAASRLIDGWGGNQASSAFWGVKRPSQGFNFDPSTFDSGAANGNILVTAAPSTVDEGESFTLTMTVRDADNATVTGFTSTASIAANTGTLAPTTTGAFSAGVRNESVSVSNIFATDSVVLTVRYNQTTSGTVAITVNNLSTVSCTVLLQGRSNHAGCTGTLANGIDTYVGLSNASGVITYNGVAPGTYQFFAKENHYLTLRRTGIVISGDTTVTTGTLLAGDANNDDRIDVFDGGRVKFFQGSSNWNADIDGSGTVDATDLGYVRSNFSRRGQ